VGKERRLVESKRDTRFAALQVSHWRMIPDDAIRLQPLRDRLADWGSLWGIPSFAERVALRTSRRMRTSLGSYDARRVQLTVANWLVAGPLALLEEVLCHEAAHAAVHTLHGRHAKAHGTEWRALMEQAGVEPRVRMPWGALPASRRVPTARRGLWEHRCPVCQVTRVARTRVSRWRCRSCREAGRDGRLVIWRLPQAMEIDR
jgi:predicted SprT family Zn-dependent metalloprotease